MLGFGTSFLPKVMEYFQDKRDKAHELAMVAAQTDAQVKLEAKLEAANNVDADIRESEALLRHDASVNRKPTNGW